MATMEAEVDPTVRSLAKILREYSGEITDSGRSNVDLFVGSVAASFHIFSVGDIFISV